MQFPACLCTFVHTDWGYPLDDFVRIQIVVKAINDQNTFLCNLYVRTIVFMAKAAMEVGVNN